MITTTHGLLAAHSFLAGLTREQLARLAPWGHPSQLADGARIFSEGGAADRFWLIREGRVALDIHVPGRGDVVIETLGPGAVLGWSWLFPPYRWHLGATVVTRTAAIEMDGVAVRRVCAEDPQLAAELYRRFMEVMADRLQATRVRLLDMYGDGS